MKLPKMYAPVKLKFWSLRNGLGSSYGVIYDIDTEVVRRCRRVLIDNGWKWQIINYHRDVEWDYSLEQDREILDCHGCELEYELIDGDD